MNAAFRERGTPHFMRLELWPERLQLMLAQGEGPSNLKRL